MGATRYSASDPVVRLEQQDISTLPATLNCPFSFYSIAIFVQVLLDFEKGGVRSLAFESSISNFAMEGHLAHWA